MQKGFVSQVSFKERYYSISKENNEIYQLAFEECGSNKFVIGDILEFEEYHSEKYGVSIFDPVKIGNKYFEELIEMIDTDTTIVAFVYEQKQFGYNVTYNGFNCFLPNKEAFVKTNYKKLGLDILNSFQEFNVKDLKDDFIILSRKAILKHELKGLIKDEIEKLEVGFTFTGSIKSSNGYGVFVSYEYSIGLLHISKIFPDYKLFESKENKKKLKSIMENIFSVGKEIIVSIEEKNCDQYILNWHVDNQINKELNSDLINAIKKVADIKKGE